MKSYSVLLSVAALVALNACGSSATSSSGSSGTVTVSSLSALPDLTDMISGDAASSNVSALHKKVVSGTAPVLKDLTSDDVDNYFWNGVLAEITDAGEVTSDEQFGAYWDGEGACRMAQNVGYAFQNIESSGSSMCYMKNMPNAESGVTITGDFTNETLFAQAASTKLVKVSVTAPEGEGDGPGPQGDMNVFIRVYGTGTDEGSSGYATDLYFCHDGDVHPAEYEQIRVNSSAGTMTQLSYHDDDNGTFLNNFAASLLETADDTIAFDPDAPATADYTFLSHEGFNNKGYVSVESGVLTSKNWNEFDGQSGKSYIVSSYTGSGVDDLAFDQAGFAMSWTNGDFSSDFSGATEFQTSHYQSVNSGSYYDLAAAFDFDADDYFSGSLEVADSYTAPLATYDCAATPDATVTMDFGDSAVQDIAAGCESKFNDMNFCDSEVVQAAREIIFGYHP